MKKGLNPASPRRGKILFPAAFVFGLTLLPALWTVARALELGAFPLYSLSRDEFSVSFFREEKPSFYWVNVGVPDAFFKNVQQFVYGPPPNPVVYSMRGVEYGLSADAWLDSRLQLRVVFPFEANALSDLEGNPQNAAKFGDMEIGASYLLEGKREKGNFIGVDGWFRVPTGTNPFNMEFPLLSTGKGASEEGLGLVMCQEVGGFSFFQSIHYEKTQPITVDSSNSLFGAGTFQWPDNWEARGRVEYLVFHRAQRFVSLFYEVQFRMSGLMEFNQRALPYGYGQTTDQLFYPMGGMIVRVDKEFSVQGQMGFFPYELSKYRPDGNMLFSLDLIFRPI